MGKIEKKSAKGTKRRASNDAPLLLIALPGILYLLVNNYIPMFGIFLAFKDFSYAKGIFGSDWNGLKNFEYLFNSDALIIFRNTLLYNLTFIVLGTVFAIMISIMIVEQGKKLRAKFFQSSLLLPNLLSWVIISFIGFAFLSTDNGFINTHILEAMNKEPISFYMEKKYWPFILTLVYLWKNLGYMSIIYVASIAGIDASIYEAAKIDGATKLEQIRHITLPLLKPTVIMLTILSIGRIFFSDFGLFYQVPMNSGAIYSVTQTIDTYVYRGLMELNDVGMSAAAGLFQSVLGFILVLSTNALVKRYSEENALF